MEFERGIETKDKEFSPLENKALRLAEKTEGLSEILDKKGLRTMAELVHSARERIIFMRPGDYHGGCVKDLEELVLFLEQVSEQYEEELSERNLMDKK